MKTNTLMDFDIKEIDRQVLSPGAMKKAKLTPLSSVAIPQGKPMEILARTRSIDEILSKAPLLYRR
jgi:hypothetical protein